MNLPPLPPSLPRLSRGLRAVAIIEAAKGALVLLAGFGLFSLIHRDVQQSAERLVAHARLNPAAHYPRIFLDLVGQATDLRLRLFAFGAVAYALVRFVEAYGLWSERRWAEWFGALSGGLFIPVELREVLRHASKAGLAVLIVNVAVVVMLVYGLRHTGRAARPVAGRSPALSPGPPDTDAAPPA